MSDQNLLHDQSAHFKWRLLKDRIARHAVAVGGVGVIFAILLIFFYLFSVVMPLFSSASVETTGDAYSAPSAEVVHVALEEYGEIGMRVRTDGQTEFFEANSGNAYMDAQQVNLPDGARIVSVGVGEPEHRLSALGLDNGSVVVIKDKYRISYPNDVRTITPELQYPLGEAAMTLFDAPVKVAVVRNDEERGTLAAASESGQVKILSMTREENMFSDEPEVVTSEHVIDTRLKTIDYIELSIDHRELYLVDRDGRLEHWFVDDPANPEMRTELQLVKRGATVTALDMLNGGISLIVANSEGGLRQLFPVRDENGIPRLTDIRTFEPMPAAVVLIVPESRRKGFAVADAEGHVGFYNATANRQAFMEELVAGAPAWMALSPRAHHLLTVLPTGESQHFEVHNEHPEVSWSSLWGKVWYESYQEPEYTWQSSSASNDFEPKLSLMPLAFGTLKAAFYAMLVAIPIAILGAIYTAYFMAPSIRQLVKPGIEIMEALPTVILGFLAGLWLAPHMETHLPAVFSLLIVLPLGTLLTAWAWTKMPDRIRFMVPEGWEAALLIPTIMFLTWFAFAVSAPIEGFLFGGDVRLWMTDELGWDFDQRNSLVIGIAMGFAVIPTIFSITEDAVFSVPRHLTMGSLALGATRWQTLSRVVILTASPGIFSAVMIGLGRAVGETMIVLMATGNTPVMDFSVFSGMRTLSANIAVEMPESEVDSTHYRVLFLAGLVLFLFTFVFNTLAESVRQRLRKQYGSL